MRSKREISMKPSGIDKPELRVTNIISTLNPIEKLQNRSKSTINENLQPTGFKSLEPRSKKEASDSVALKTAPTSLPKESHSPSTTSAGSTETNQTSSCTTPLKASIM
jgi:hypothetical protein